MKTRPTPYLGRKIALGTKHLKDRAISPAFERHLGARIIVPAGIDTDTLGTFTGEIPRIGTTLQVVRKKARLGMRANGCPFGIASEGSFGPHPAAPFMAAGVETMIFIDDERKFEISETDIFEDTNFCSTTVSSPKEMMAFVKQAHFPSHALVVSPEENKNSASLRKGIRTHSALEKAICTVVAVSPTGKALIETDMRAHMNPTRMSCLRKLAVKLARRLATPCPRCNAPGWGAVGVKKGLLCESCRNPTEFIAHQILGCAVCRHRQRISRSDGRLFADPANCSYCNP